MKIEKQGTVLVQFKDVKPGQVFECEGAIFIKCYDFTTGKIIKVNLNDGYASNVPNDNTEVAIYENAKVVVE